MGRYDHLNIQKVDLLQAKANLEDAIIKLTQKMKEQFYEEFSKINQNFNEVFRQIFGGGKAALVLQDEENVLECGIDIIAQPPGKKLQNLSLLSGGEKALTAIVILFSILKLKPTPFCILDEIEAALDETNVYQFTRYLRQYTRNTQFIVITHRKGTMEAGDTLYGVTMEEKGVGFSLRMEKRITMAVKAFSPPDRRERFCSFLPGGWAMMSIPHSKTFSSSCKTRAALPPPNICRKTSLKFWLILENSS
jgi:chromosome segregation protein